MRVGVVCPYDWSYPGGVRTHIIGLTAALRRKGIDVEIMAPASSPDMTIYALGRTVGIPYNGSVARLNFSFAARARIAKRLRQGDIDLLHIHEPFSPSVSFLALMQTSLPVVATFHMSRERSFAYSVARPLLEYFERKIDHRIVVSGAARSLIARYLPPRPGAETLLPNAIELQRYRSAASDGELQALKPFVLFVGRNEPRKGLSVLVDAMERVRKEKPCNLVVGGVTRSEVQQLIGKVPSWIHPLGPV
ncbi:MAG: glycosyltransferase family 4 protein, partial [Acidimicrobiia bacterium]